MNLCPGRRWCTPRWNKLEASNLQENTQFRPYSNKNYKLLVLNIKEGKLFMNPKSLLATAINWSNGEDEDNKDEQIEKCYSRVEHILIGRPTVHGTSIAWQIASNTAISIYTVTVANIVADSLKKYEFKLTIFVLLSAPIYLVIAICRFTFADHLKHFRLVSAWCIHTNLKKNI
jgi:hypothetical protein